MNIDNLEKRETTVQVLAMGNGVIRYPILVPIEEVGGTLNNIVRVQFYTEDRHTGSIVAIVDKHQLESCEIESCMKWKMLVGESKMLGHTFKPVSCDGYQVAFEGV